MENFFDYAFGQSRHVVAKSDSIYISNVHSDIIPSDSELENEFNEFVYENEDLNDSDLNAIELTIYRMRLRCGMQMEAAEYSATFRRFIACALTVFSGQLIAMMIIAADYGGIPPVIFLLVVVFILMIRAAWFYRKKRKLAKTLKSYNYAIELVKAHKELKDVPFTYYRREYLPIVRPQ